MMKTMKFWASELPSSSSQKKILQNQTEKEEIQDQTLNGQTKKEESFLFPAFRKQPIRGFFFRSTFGSRAKKNQEKDEV